jgi:segregation and condensation protein B
MYGRDDDEPEDDDALPPVEPEDTGDEDSEPPDNVIQLVSFDRREQPPEAPVLDEPAPAGELATLPDDQGALVPPPSHLLDAALEALLLAADGPMSEGQLDGWLANPGISRVRAAIEALRERYRRVGSGIRLVQVAKGWQLRTDMRFAPWVSAMRGGKPVKLSRPALEVLAVVAYRQPVTRAEVDELRGVDSGGVLRLLCERGLVTSVGRKDEPGRPLLYGTSPEFLALFGLRDLSDLPTLRDLRELQRDPALEEEPPPEGGPEDGAL